MGSPREIREPGAARGVERCLGKLREKQARPKELGPQGNPGKLREVQGSSGELRGTQRSSGELRGAQGS